MGQVNSKYFVLGKIDISSLISAHKSLVEILKEEFNDIVRDAAIQRFEYSFALSWKFMKRVLTENGHEVNSPKDVIRTAAQDGLVDDPEVWFEFLNYRNLTTHTYKQDTAEGLYEEIPVFANEMKKLVDSLMEIKKAA